VDRKWWFIKTTRNALFVHQKGQQEILFIPKPVPSHDPLGWILSWQEDFVEVNKNTCGQGWQHVEQKVAKIVAELGDVGGVYEKNISRSEVIVPIETRCTPDRHIRKLRGERCELLEERGHSIRVENKGRIG
jgi:hypothetical protein